jgi:two-component system, chemotaxis family, chemotaxis protein CheY
VLEVLRNMLGKLGGVKVAPLKHCLIVDDSAEIRRAARSILEDLSFEISEAGNGLEALERCRNKMPDAVLLDGAMPVMSGMEFLQALRSQEGGGAPKVIYCTNLSDAFHIVRAIDAGANEYLMKPFDRGVMEAKFHEVGLI